MDAEVHTRERLEVALRTAIQQKEINVCYQPLVELRTGNVVGFEALARWNHRELGEVEPELFMTIAEDMGLMRELTADLLGAACRAANTWPASVFLAFNVSAVQLRDPQLATQLLTILRLHDLSPVRLEIEVTESALVHDGESTRAIIARLRAEGVKVALDDFGRASDASSRHDCLGDGRSCRGRGIVGFFTNQPVLNRTRRCPRAPRVLCVNPMS
jgi:EAL domain-containing protein (putative c-di-GMP-specific phosphodiesterase class I)